MPQDKTQKVTNGLLSIHKDDGLKEMLDLMSLEKRGKNMITSIEKF
jgi:hypothetical protein